MKRFCRKPMTSRKLGYEQSCITKGRPKWMNRMKNCIYRKAIFRIRDLWISDYILTSWIWVMYFFHQRFCFRVGRMQVMR